MKSNSKRSKAFFKLLPKIDLHRHLEGSLRFETMLEIARTFDLDLPHDQPDHFRRLVEVMPDDPHDYKNFLSKFKTLRQLYRTPEIIQRIAREAVFDAAEDNVRHLEIRFTPVALGVIRQIPPGEVIDLVVEAAQTAASDAGISLSLIVSMNRHESVDLAAQVVRAAVDRKTRGVAGLDLAGDEVNFSAQPFAGLFREARQAGLRLTVHAGEWGGPENVVEAIAVLEAERIGHGVRVCEDPQAVALAAERQVAFEVCPTSNYQTGVFSQLNRHNLVAMFDEGLRVTLNTDDPGISAIELTHEYLAASQELGASLDRLRAMTLEAAKSAFLPDESKQGLVERMAVDFDHAVASQGKGPFS